MQAATVPRRHPSPAGGRARARASARLLVGGRGRRRGPPLTTTYVPFLLHRIDDAPALIGVVMTVNAVSGFLVPLVTGVWSDRRDGRGLGAGFRSWSRAVS